MFRLLDLPLELRLQVCDHVLNDGDHAVTFSIAKLDGTDSEKAGRLYSKHSRAFLGLPFQHIPVIRLYYDASLLCSEPALTRASERPSAAEQGRCEYAAYPAILLVNRQVRAEVLHHFPTAVEQRIDIFISYPHGLYVFDSLGYHLLRKARTIRISGNHIPTESDLLYRDWKTSSGDRIPPPLRLDYGKMLSSMLTSVLGIIPRSTQLQMRVMYASRNAYPAIWGHDSSPIAIALSSICAMDISLEVCRGHKATGIILTAKPNSKGRRDVRTVWRAPPSDIPDAEGDLPNDWVVDKRWPDFHWDGGDLPSVCLDTGASVHFSPSHGPAFVSDDDADQPVWTESDTESDEEAWERNREFVDDMSADEQEVYNNPNV